MIICKKNNEIKSKFNGEQLDILLNHDHLYRMLSKTSSLVLIEDNQRYDHYIRSNLIPIGSYLEGQIQLVFYKNLLKNRPSAFVKTEKVKDLVPKEKNIHYLEYHKHLTIGNKRNLAFGR